MNQFPGKNYFTLPNEIFSLGLGAGEIRGLRLPPLS